MQEVVRRVDRKQPDHVVAVDEAVDRDQQIDASFDTGANVQGSDLIIFEVNGWHNLVHIVSGLLGIALARRNDTARLFALGFGAVYDEAEDAHGT